MIKRKYFALTLIGIVFCSTIFCSCKFEMHEKQKEKVNNPFVETKEERDERMKWWREAKFGMFIHWGVYAVPAGMYNGEKVNHVSSWIMQHEHIPVAEYREYAKQFNPTKYDPERWVQLAKEAGMKYLVITTKHHEGFALYDSKVTDWNVVDASPYGKDLLKPLVEACRDNDIRVGFYYSHAVDYVHPGGEVQSLDYKPGGHWDPVQKTKDMDAYFSDIVVPQVREILTNYGDIDILWWDGGGWYSVNRKRADMILSVTNEYPDIIMNNRLGGDYSGHWRTPEQYIPATGLSYDWETCMTMNDTWGYRSWDHNWKSAEKLIRNLVDIVSKGGNFLLNVGPKADGTIPQASVDRLKVIGRWMSVNSASIYGTTASPFENLTWGRSTKKDLRNGFTQLFLQVFNWPEDGKLRLPRLQNEIHTAYLLSDDNRTQRQITVEGHQVVIDVPVDAPDKICSVVALEIKGYPVVLNPPVIEAEAQVLFDQMEISLKGNGPGVSIHYTLNGKIPTKQSPIYKKEIPVILTESATINAALFSNGIRVSEVRTSDFSKKDARPAEHVKDLKQGLRYQYFEGVWSDVPDYSNMNSVAEGITYFCNVTKSERGELFGMRFSGYIKIPETGVYRFHAEYNDGCNVIIGEQQVLKSPGRVMDSEIKREATGMAIVLEKGLHPITVNYFQRIDHSILELFWSGPGFKKQPIKAQVLFHGAL